ncbi:hypothetical protein WKI13_20590 [Teredinibacter turnerae]|uniref:hypothetical protein n=1 Tax=Teredinibacter turnerae TaxID=2426 RepID=UPI00037751C5|nr:hypothetical protein [Teredinibacter turnerae]
MDTPTTPPKRPRRPERITVPIKQEDDGSPYLGVKDDIVLIKEGDELIFESAIDFDIHFIGRSPIDLSRRGKKYFSSEDGKIVIQTNQGARRARRECFDRDVDYDICRKELSDKARKRKIITDKRPRRTSRGVELYFDVIIDGIVLDPKLNIDDPDF